MNLFWLPLPIAFLCISIISKVNAVEIPDILIEKGIYEEPDNVYSAILNDDSDYVGHDRLICIHDQFFMASPNMDTVSFKADLLERVNGLTGEVLENLFTDKNQKRILDTKFKMKNKYIFFLENKKNLPSFSWTIGSNKFSKNPKHIRFSKIGFDRQHSKALVRTEISDGLFQYGNGLYLLEKKTGSWKVIFHEKWME